MYDDATQPESLIERPRKDPDFQSSFTPHPATATTGRLGRKHQPTVVRLCVATCARESRKRPHKGPGSPGTKPIVARLILLCGR